MKNTFCYIYISVLFLFSIPTVVQADEVKKLKIGVILHLTGDLAMQSSAFREGIELAVEEANSKGPEQHISLTIEDGQNNAKVSNTAAQKLINMDHVDAAIISSYLDAMSSGQNFEKAKTPAIVLWDSNPEIDAIGEYVFAIGPWTPSSGEEASRFATENLKAKSAVIVTNQDSWSEAVGTYFDKDFRTRGGKIMDKVLLNPDQVDFRSVISKIKTLEPDVIYTPLVNNLVPFYTQLKQQNLKAAVVSSDIIADEHISKAPSAFEGVYQTNIQDPDSKEYLSLQNRYKKKYGRDISMPWFVAVGYDSVGVLLKAWLMGKGSKENLKEALYSIKAYKGSSTEISINERGSSPQYERTYQLKLGKFVPVE